ncbi:MAG: hypothetical protein Q7K42_02185, partial [Candidatus Diapherotrites archaeon]|nr:hypothetical protein [Candidatus Diapherotrites archaeon]
IEKPPKAVKEIKTKPAPRPTKRKEKPKPAEKKPARTRTRTPVSPRDKEEGILKAIEKETSTKPVPKSGDSPQYKKAMGIFKTIPEEHRRNFTVLYSRTMKHPTISAKLIQVAKGKNISLENYHLELLEKVAKEFANILKESKTTGANIFTLTAKAYQKIVEGDLARLK